MRARQATSFDLVEMLAHQIFWIRMQLQQLRQTAMQELGVKVPEWDHIRAAQDTVQLRSRLPEPFALDKVK